MEELKIPFICGRVKWSHKPHSKADKDATPEQQKEIIECQRPQHYQVVEATPQQIFNLICEGRCWRAGILKEGAKNLTKVSFTGSRIIALDFDMCEISPQEVVEYCQTQGIEPNFYYYSFSQGKKPGFNYRIVWLLSEPISIEEYESLYLAFLKDALFCQADPKCKDISRLWHGTRNGGDFIKDTLIDFKCFDIFPREEVRQEKKKTSKKDKDGLEQADTEQTFIMDSLTFPWNTYLSGVCDLWDKWRTKQYLHHTQRLLLFSELKCIKYEKTIAKSILDEIMSYYDFDLYKDSGCSREQIKYFLSTKYRVPDNKLVIYNGKEYTIAEWFNSGDYKQRDIAIRNKFRVSRAELQEQADKRIPQMLAEDGIQYIECQTEAGKTERVINYLSSLDLTQTKIIYSIPTYILIDEFIKRITKKGVPREVIFSPRKVEYSAEDLLYLNAGFPEGIKATAQMKERKKELGLVEDENKNGLFIITHAALAHLRNITAKKIIIDENIEDVLVARNTISLSYLNALKTFIYTLDEILNENPRQIKAKGKTTEEKIEYIKSELEAVHNDLDRLTKSVSEDEPQTIIKGINTERIINFINFRRLIKDDAREGLKGIGKLRNADLLSVGIDWEGRKYLFFENISNLLTVAIDRGISVKLLTGTPKISQLEAGLPEALKGSIEQFAIDRAEPLGNIYQWLIQGASGSKAKIIETMNYAIDELEKRGVDWQHTFCLTLKNCVDLARMKGFYIPMTEDGEEIYIENCAGLDSFKGKDLIVIGKSDIPKSDYLDMLHKKTISDRQKSITRPIADTGIETKIHGFLERELWDLQAEQLREPIEQAVGRARTLWYDCNVYVFCDFPVRNATEYIKGAI